MPRAPTSAASLDRLLVHRGWVTALARSLARDASSADDLVQQTWLRAIESPPRDEGAAGAGGAAWLATVVRNLARDAHRRATRRTAREETAARREAMPSADRLVARAEAERRLIAAVVALDEPYRSVVLLRFFEGLPPRRIAVVTGTHAATVRTRLHRALAMLRARLGGDADGAALALLVPGGAALAPRLGELAGGALVAGSKKTAVLVLVLLLVGGVAWQAAANFSDDDGGAVAPSPAAPATDDDASQRPRQRAAAPTDADPATSPATVDAAPVPPTPSIGDPAPAAPAAERLKVHVLRNLPAPTGPDEVRLDREGADEDDADGEIAVGAGSMRMVGWSRWAPVPAKGRATWKGRVVDRDGRPVADAAVLRVSLDETGARTSPTSWEWVTEVTRTGSDGSFEAASQPDGHFLVAAEWHGRMNGQRGLDLTGAARVQASGKETAAGLEIRLPFSAARLGGVRGVVLDEEGAPVQSAIVAAGRDGAWTTADGKFALAGLDAGECELRVEEAGYSVFRKSLDVHAGETSDVEVRLTLAQRGTLEVAGRVTDDAGAPIPAMRMFLADGSPQGIRYVSTGRDGRYRFAKLPDAWSKRDLAVMPVPMGEGADFLQERREDVRAPDTTCDFVLRRTTPLRLLLRSAAGDAAIPLFNLGAKLEIPGEEARQLLQSSSYDEKGEFTFPVARGRLVLTVEAKDHRGVEVAIEIPDVKGPKEAVIVLARE